MPSSRTEPLERGVLEEASRWVVQHSGGEADAAAQADFNAWYHGDPRHAAAYDKLSRLWQRMGEVSPSALARRPIRRKLRNAASIALLVLMANWLEAPSLQDAGYASGTALRQVALPDGSLAILDAGSAIALVGAPERRQVRLLAGRALFEVQPRQPGTPPFVVSTPEAAATALGTRFTVERAADGTRVDVHESQVKVQCLQCETGQSLTLSPGESASVSDRDLEYVSSPASGGSPAWSEGRLDLDDVSLPSAAQALSRYTGKHILVLGDTARSQRVSGSILVADPEHALTLLLGSSPVRIHSLPGLLVLR